MVKIVNENEFKNEINEGIVVVDFFATWCNPCKMLSPVLDELSEEMAGKVKFLKVDVDECVNLADEYSITNIPAVGIFKNGEKQEVSVGFAPKDVLGGKINNYL
ncbi:MAG: thioredoxin [Clostridium sp.]|uniref:thioredoxin n=1 Tax=Clostridium sp. DSM 8431 TaxID=1761781 RepID=UPI0008F120DE|nr:thioredoxin [Clostridium sp. DSM 8431]MCR4943309.1 thioredoxin [Clostridium sp.]SFU85913.1 thioredoxin [Clostridium sp. DSM 8431]